MGWDDELPAELAKEFQDWLDELKVVSEYSFKRYIFGTEKDELAKPPPRDSIELHVFVDGGLLGFGCVIFVRFKDGKIFKMRRIFACSRVVSPKSSLTVPRRELSGILLGIKKVVELAELLEIA